MSKLPQVDVEVISDNGDHFLCSRDGKEFKVAKTGRAGARVADMHRQKMARGGMIPGEEGLPDLTDDEMTSLDPWRDLISQVAKRTGSDPYLLGATMLRESGGDPAAVGDGGHSKGLFQIHDQYHPGVPTDPESQATAAANIYSRYRQELGDAASDPRALPSSYNAGPERVAAAVREGRNPDSVTTGGDYGKWVTQKAEAMRRRKVFEEGQAEMTPAQAAIGQSQRALAGATGRPVPEGPAQQLGPTPPAQQPDAARYVDRPAATASAAEEAAGATGVPAAQGLPLDQNPAFNAAEMLWQNPANHERSAQERAQQASAMEPQPGAAMQGTGAGPDAQLPPGTNQDGSWQGPVQPSAPQVLDPQAQASAAERDSMYGTGAQQELSAAQQEAYGGAKGVALAQQHLAESNLAVNDWLTKESDRLKNQRVQQFTQWQQRGDEIFKQVSAAKVDPNRWFASRSTGQKIAGAIAMALGGMLNGRTGQPNPALQMINAAIERDVDAQKANIDQANSVYKFHLTQGMEQREAYALAKADLREHAAGVLKQNMDRYVGASAAPMLDQTLGELRMQSLQQRQQLAMSGLDMDYKKLEMGAAKMRTALQMQQMLQTQQMASGSGLSDQQFAALPREEQARYVNMQGRWLPTPNQGVANEVREAQDASSQISSMVGQMRQQREKSGRGWLPSFIGKDAAKAKALQTQMMIPLRKIMQLGVMSEGDKAMLRDLVPNVADISQGDDSIYVRLDQLQKEAERQAAEITKKRVLGMSSMGMVNATPVK